MRWNYVRFFLSIRINTSINTTHENKWRWLNQWFITHFYHSYRKDHHEWAQNGLDILAKFHHVRVDIIVINEQNSLEIQERFHHVRVDIVVMTTHMKAHGNTSFIYKYNSNKSSSLLEAYKLSLKYITVIANCRNSLSVNLSQRHLHYIHIFVHD